VSPSLRGVIAACGIAVLCGVAAHGLAADPPATETKPLAESEPKGLLVAGLSGPPQALTLDDIAALPTVSVTMPEAAPNGRQSRTFDGPLLWTVLAHLHLVDAEVYRDQVRQTVLLTGNDGYTAILAMGELSPAFENKQVIVAERMDGQKLGIDHLRVVVASDKHGGRSVRDLVRIQIMAVPTSKL
jgi:hypothetical protein